MVPFAGEEKVVSELFPAVLAVLCLGKAAGAAAAAAAAANWESGRGCGKLLCVPFFPLLTFSPPPVEGGSERLHTEPPMAKGNEPADLLLLLLRTALMMIVSSLPSSFIFLPFEKAPCIE